MVYDDCGNEYDENSVMVDWSAVMRVTMLKYVKLGIQVTKLYIPKNLYDIAMQSYLKDVLVDNNSIGISKNNTFDFFVTYPEYIEELDCKGEEILSGLRWKLAVVFNNIYTDEFIRQMDKEGNLNIQLYAKKDETRDYWSIEEGEEMLKMYGEARSEMFGIGLMNKVGGSEDEDENENMNMNNDESEEDKKGEVNNENDYNSDGSDNDNADNTNL